MDILRLFDDYKVPYQTEGHKHCRPGWVNTECPFCVGNPGLHLGFELTKEIFVCWRCGWKPRNKAIAKLLHISEQEAQKIIREYGGKSRLPAHHATQILKKKRFRYPTGTDTMQMNHRKYLERRGFDPEEIERVWGVLGTGPVSHLGKIEYKHRLLIPIYWDGKIVSFQTRDITGKHNAKYMACPANREKVEHKHIIYAHPETAETAQEVICVEGVTDVWRLGKRAVAVFGIKYTHHQVRILSKLFSRITVVFDDDPQAIIQAKKLAGDLLFRGVDATVMTINGDPGGLSDKEARMLVNTIFPKG